MSPIPDTHGLELSPHFPPHQSSNQRASLDESIFTGSSAAMNFAQTLRGQRNNLTTQFSLLWVRQEEQLHEIQIFRAQVAHHRNATKSTFTGITSPVEDFHPQSLVQDIFDGYCEHIMVKDGLTGAIVAACRLLTPAQAKRVGGLELEHDFDLTRIRAWRSKVLELGRVCIHPSLKASAQRRLLRLLQEQVLAFVQSNQLLMVVCMAQEVLAEDSATMPEVGLALKRPSIDDTRELWQHIRERYLCPFEFHLRARNPLNALKDDGVTYREKIPGGKTNDANLNGLDVSPSEPLRTYLQLGAKVMGQPCWSREHGAIHWALMMRTQDLLACSSSLLRN